MTSRLPTWMRCLTLARTKLSGTNGTAPSGRSPSVDLATTRTACEAAYNPVDYHHHKYGITIRTYRMFPNYRHRITHVEETSPFHNKLIRLDIITKVNQHTTEHWKSEKMVKEMEGAFSKSCCTMRVVRVCDDEVCVKDLLFQCSTDEQEGLSATCNSHESPNPRESSPNPSPSSSISPELPATVESCCDDQDLCSRECTTCCQQADTVNFPTEAIADGDVHVTQKNVQSESMHNVISLITERREELFIKKTYMKCLEHGQYLIAKDELKLVRNPRKEGDLHDCFFKVSIYVGLKPIEEEPVEIFLIQSLSCREHKAVGVDLRDRHGREHIRVGLQSSHDVMRKLDAATEETKDNRSGALKWDRCLFFLNDNCEESEEVLSSTKMKDYYLCASGDHLVVKEPEEDSPIHEAKYRFQFVHPRHHFPSEEQEI